MPGFYLHRPPYTSSKQETSPLLLGPYHGRPACQYIPLTPPKGVCAAGFLSEKGVVVDDVEQFPGHIGELSTSPLSHFSQQSGRYCQLLASPLLASFPLNIALLSAKRAQTSQLVHPLGSAP